MPCCSISGNVSYDNLQQYTRTIPEQVFSHAVKDDLISRKEFESLFITVKEVLNAPHRVQFISPFEECEPKGFLQGQSNILNTILRKRMIKLVVLQQQRDKIIAVE